MGNLSRIYVDGSPKGRVGLVYERDNKPESNVISIPKGLTNNEAEYMAAISAFDFISSDRDWIIYMDSKLVVMQVQGLWRCRANNLFPYLDSLLEKLDNFPADVTFKWVRREHNPAGVLLDRFKDLENGLNKEIDLEDKALKPMRRYAERLYAELSPENAV